MTDYVFKKWRGHVTRVPSVNDICGSFQTGQKHRPAGWKPCVLVWPICQPQPTWTLALHTTSPHILLSVVFGRICFINNLMTGIGVSPAYKIGLWRMRRTQSETSKVVLLVCRLRQLGWTSQRNIRQINLLRVISHTLWHDCICHTLWKSAFQSLVYGSLLLPITWYNFTETLIRDLLL